MMPDTQRLEQFLREQHYMVIAVTLADGSPWAVPVRIKRWEGKVFEWDSKLDTVHSKALENNPTMAITLFEKKIDSQFGVYATGMGELIQEKDQGLGAYRFSADRLWINDETFIKRSVDVTNLGA